MRIRTLVAIVAVYTLASLVTGPVGPAGPSSVAHWRIGPIYVGRPISTWGDPPHYLVMVNSLIEDGDLDLRNNYDQARAGDWDVGTRFRGTEIDRHVETDRRGRERSFHAPFLPLLLAPVAWPFRDSEWVESLCIWLSLAATLCGLAYCARLPGFETRWLALLALATPLWVYARDLWTEPYQAVAWGALLGLQNPSALVLVAISAILLKYSFAVVPLALGTVDLWQGRVHRGRLLIGASVAALCVASVSAQCVFRDADHFSLFHLAGRHQHAGTLLEHPWQRWHGLVGLLLDPENGLLLFCPFLVFGLRQLSSDARLWVPALAYFLLHATFVGWRAGSGVSARYLVPMLPVLVLAVARARPRGRLFRVSVAYSAVLAIVAGLLPVAAYDKTPWGILMFLEQRIGTLIRG